MVSRQVSPSYSLTSARLPIQLLTPARSRRGGAQRPHNAPTLCHFVECIQCDWGITRFLCVELIMQWLPVFQTLIFNPPAQSRRHCCEKVKSRRARGELLVKGSARIAVLLSSIQEKGTLLSCAPVSRRISARAQSQQISLWAKIDRWFPVCQ